MPGAVLASQIAMALTVRIAKDKKEHELPESISEESQGSMLHKWVAAHLGVDPARIRVEMHDLKNRKKNAWASTISKSGTLRDQGFQRGMHLTARLRQPESARRSHKKKNRASHVQRSKKKTSDIHALAGAEKYQHVWVADETPWFDQGTEIPDDIDICTVAAALAVHGNERILDLACHKVLSIADYWDHNRSHIKRLQEQLALGTCVPIFGFRENPAKMLIALGQI